MGRGGQGDSDTPISSVVGALVVEKITMPCFLSTNMLVVVPIQPTI